MSELCERRIFTDEQELADEAADLFVWLGELAIARTGIFRVALSGGSTPKRLYANLAGPSFSTRLRWPCVEFYFGDERCVPPDHPESNFRMVNDTLLRPLGIAQKQVFRVHGEAADRDQAAREYESTIRERFSTPSPAWPQFDLILLGLGEDGHTASLFPNMPALHEKTRAVVATHAPHGIRDRITFTVPLINEAHTTVFLVSGGRKAAAVHEVLEGGSGLDDRYPAKLIRPAHGRLIWLMDREAASKLAVTKQQIEFDEE